MESMPDPLGDDNMLSEYIHTPELGALLTVADGINSLKGVSHIETNFMTRSGLRSVIQGVVSLDELSVNENHPDASACLDDAVSAFVKKIDKDNLYSEMRPWSSSGNKELDAIIGTVEEQIDWRNKDPVFTKDSIGKFISILKYRYMKLLDSGDFAEPSS